MKGVVEPRCRGRLRSRSTKGKLPFLTVRRRDSRKVLFKALEDASSPSIACLARLTMEKATLYTDEFKSYDVLDKLGYEYFKVSHSRGSYALGPIHVNGCESCNWHLRTFLRPKRGIARGRALLLR